MGCYAGTTQNVFCPKRHLNIGTLNYSSINISPFEFFSADHLLEEHSVNKKIQRQIRAHKGDKINAEVVKQFDSRFKPRYSPLYTSKCGYENGTFQDEKQFNESWRAYFKEQFAKEQIDEEVIKQVMKFDYLVFVAIIKYVYESNSVEVILKSRGINPYCEFMRKFFQKSFLNESTKLKKIQRFIRNWQIDVLFLQKVTDTFCQDFAKSEKEEYRIIRGDKLCKDFSSPSEFGDSALIIKQNSFAKAFDGRKGNRQFMSVYDDTSLSDQFKREFLKWEGTDTAILSIGNFVLLSFDIPLSLALQQQFRQKFAENLRILKIKYPKKHLVMGGIVEGGFFSQDNQIKEALAKANLCFYPPATKYNDDNYMSCHNLKTFAFSFDAWDEEGNRSNSDVNVPVCKNFVIYPRHMLAPKPGTNVYDSKKFKNITNVYAVEEDSDDEDVQPNVVQNLLKAARSKTKTIIQMYQEYQHNQNKDLRKNVPGYDTFGFLPTESHPFRDYAVVTTLVVPRRKAKEQVMEERSDIDIEEYELARCKDILTSSSEEEDHVQVESALSD